MSSALYLSSKVLPHSRYICIRKEQRKTEAILGILNKRLFRKAGAVRQRKRERKMLEEQKERRDDTYFRAANVPELEPMNLL